MNTKFVFGLPRPSKLVWHIEKDTLRRRAKNWPYLLVITIKSVLTMVSQNLIFFGCLDNDMQWDI